MQLEQLGPYRIGRQLGRGGMGTVYAAVEVDSGEQAAVKVLSPMLAHREGFRDRFEAEIESLRKLRHPNIVRLFGFGEQDDHLFYAMELVEGRSLEEELIAGRRFDWRDVTEITIQVCRALKHAHDRGVIHRDIKPANLLLAPAGLVKLSDFGIAKLFGSTGLTGDGGVLGTAEYMAPEQADGRPVTHRCDLYSLGSVMYALLARRPPFQASSLIEMLQLQRFAEPEPIRRYAPDTPAELEMMINLLLEKDPERRIPAAMVLSRRLEAMRHGLALRSGEPPQQPPPEEHEFVNAPTAAGSGSLSSHLQIPPIDEYQLSVPATRGAATNGGPALAELNVDGRASQEPPAPPQPRFTTVKEDESEEPDSGGEAPFWLAPQTWLLAACLIGVCLAIWYFVIRPPSPDRQYDRIAKIAERDKRGERLAGMESDIKAFLEQYPDDPRRETLEGYRDRIQLYRLDRRIDRYLVQRKIDNEFLAGSDSLSAVERLLVDALSHGRADPAAGVAKLQALLDFCEGDVASDPAVEHLVLKLARLKLADLRQEVDRLSKEHLEIIQRRLEWADKTSATDAQAARTVWQAVIQLYADKPWASQEVKRAKAALAK